MKQSNRAVPVTLAYDNKMLFLFNLFPLKREDKTFCLRKEFKTFAHSILRTVGFTQYHLKR